MPLMLGAINMRRRNGKVKECIICKSRFYVPSYRINTAKFCSRDCQNHQQYKHYTRKCQGCGKDFNVSGSRQLRNFCDEKCRTIKSQTEIERRRSIKLWAAQNRGSRSKYLRLQTLELHSHSCDICGYKDKDYCLDMHHKDSNPNNNSKDNLGLLCAFCHRKLHKGDLNYAVAAG